MNIEQTAEKIYREVYGLDHKVFHPRKTMEIGEWLTNGDPEEMSLPELVAEWREFDAAEIQARMG